MEILHKIWIRCVYTMRSKVTKGVHTLFGFLDAGTETVVIAILLGVTDLLVK